MSPGEEPGYEANTVTHTHVVDVASSPGSSPGESLGMRLQLYHFVAMLRYHVFVEQVHFCKVHNR